MASLLSSFYRSADSGLPSPSASSPSTSRSSWLTAAFASSSTSAGNGSGNQPKLPRKASSIRSPAELDLVQNGGTFPAFPFPQLSRSSGAAKDKLELELGGGAGGPGGSRHGKQRWSRQRVANVVYVAVFWLLVVCWLRALGGYGLADDQ